MTSRCLDDLYSLTLHGNPLEERKGYRAKVLTALPQLRSLDFTNVTAAELKQIQIRKSASAAAENYQLQNRVKSTFWGLPDLQERIFAEISPQSVRSVKQSKDEEVKVEKETDFWEEFFPRIPIDIDKRKSPWIRGFNKYEEFDKFSLFPDFVSVNDFEPLLELDETSTTLS